MSYSNLININNELTFGKMATTAIRLYDRTNEKTLTADLVEYLLLRIQALEEYIAVLQTTYRIEREDGTFYEWQRPLAPT